jgi:hypothetical protein
MLWKPQNKEKKLGRKNQVGITFHRLPAGPPSVSLIFWKGMSSLGCSPAWGNTLVYLLMSCVCSETFKSTWRLSWHRWYSLSFVASVTLLCHKYASHSHTELISLFPEHTRTSLLSFYSDASSSPPPVEMGPSPRPIWCHLHTAIPGSLNCM